jgi:hypothetical protein
LRRLFSVANDLRLVDVQNFCGGQKPPEKPMLYISGGLKPPEPHPYKTKKILAAALSRRNHTHIKQKKILFVKSFLFFVYGKIFSIYI